MEWLKKILGEEVYKTIPENVLKTLTEKVGSKKILVEEKDGDYIPKTRFDEVNTKKADLDKELATTKESLAKVQTDFDNLEKEKAGGSKTLEDKVTDLTKQLTDMQTQLKDKDTQLNLRDRRSSVEKELRARHVNENYLNMLMNEFERKNPLDKLEIVDGKIKDAENIFKPFQESNKDLFGEVKRQGYTPKDGEGNGAGEYYTMEQLKSMPKSEVAANMEKAEKSLAYHQNNQGK
ncbi:MAG: phage scaffolding protein [Ignavibacteriales bacterium]|nr:phage scaffolding protein [Ignavibacteriales bacterium]